MVGLSGLWIPLVLSAVFVFIASSLIHMVLGWHNGEYQPPPQQDAVLDALRPFKIPPGEYMMPMPATMKDMRTPEHLAKMEAGPVATLIVRPNGMGSMTPMLVKWFVYVLVVSLFTAYVTGRTTAQGAPFLWILRIAGSVSFAGYALGIWQAHIWGGKPLKSTIMANVDALIFCVITGATFGWLWPK